MYERFGDGKCVGQKLDKGPVESVHHCAHACQNVSGMFNVEMKDGADMCTHKDCPCQCESNATPDGTCDGDSSIQRPDQYALYSFAGMNFYCYH